MLHTWEHFDSLCISKCWPRLSSLLLTRLHSYLGVGYSGQKFKSNIGDIRCGAPFFFDATLIDTDRRVTHSHVHVLRRTIGCSEVTIEERMDASLDSEELRQRRR